MATPMILPPVTYNEATCSYAAAINTQAYALMGTISGVLPLIDPDLVLPPLGEIDLDGDDVPDQYQMALLGAALCAVPDLVVQLDANKAKYTGLLTDLDAVVAILLGSGTTPAAATRLTAVADILDVPAYNTDPSVAAVIDGLRSAATTLSGLTAQIPSAITPALVHQLLGQLGTFQTAVAALIGLSSDMQTQVTDLLTGDLMTQITDIRGQVVDIIAAVPDLIALPGLTTPQITTITSLAADAQIIVDVLDRTIAITVPGALKVYGVSAKLAGDPFSGTGDYDADGNTNLVTYNATKATIEGFVAAASGANLFWPGNTNMPVAGVLGLMALAGACALGGATSIRRKK